MAVYFLTTNTYILFSKATGQCKSEGKVDQVLKHPQSGLSWYQQVVRRSPGDFRGCSEKGTLLCGLSIRTASMLTRSIEGKVEELYTFGRQHVRLWSRALGTAERGATPTGIVLEPATKDR